MIIIAQGRIVADAAPIDLMRQSSLHNAVTVRFAAGEAERARKLLEGIERVARIEDLPGIPNALRVFPKNGEPVALTISELSRSQNWRLEQLSVEQGRLDEVFRKVTHHIAPTRSGGA